MRMNKRQFLKAIVATLIGLKTWFLAACRSKPASETNESDLKLLSMRFRCAADSSRAMAVSQTYGNLMQGGSPDERNITFLQMAQVPDSYLEHLRAAQNQNGFRITTSPVLAPPYQGAAGLCWGVGAPFPQKIELAGSAFRSQHVVLHEVGHAVHSLVDRNSSRAGRNAQDMLGRTFQSIQNSGESSRMWDYAMENEVEFFAVGFTSFYCSEAARSDMRATFPQSWSFFSSVLEAPPGSGSGLANNGGVAPGQDQGGPTTKPLEGSTPNSGGVTPPVTIPPTIPGMGGDALGGGGSGGGDPWAQLIELLTGLMGGGGYGGAKLRLNADGIQIVRPTWPTLYLGRSIWMELGVTGQFGPDQLRVMIDAGATQIEIPAAFQVDPLNRRNFLSELRLPDAAAFRLEEGELERNGQISITLAGKTIASQRYSFKGQHVDFETAPPYEAFKRKKT